MVRVRGRFLFVFVQGIGLLKCQVYGCYSGKS